MFILRINDKYARGDLINIELIKYILARLRGYRALENRDLIRYYSRRYPR